MSVCETQPMRLLASIRLSRDTDTTNAPATQRADIQEWADEHGHIIVAWAEDIDVSGDIPIRERSGVGPWLDEDHLPLWDGLIGKELDRLFRSTLDFLLWVRDFGKKTGKIIIDVSDGTDTSTPQGYRRLLDRARDAEFERMKISERRARAAKRIRSQARYGGGLVPFGYQKVKISDGWTLEIYESHAELMRSIVKRVLDGASVNSIVADLNSKGIPSPADAQRIMNGKTPRGLKWATNSLFEKLRSPTLKGYVVNYPAKGDRKQARIVYGEDGLPLRRPAIIDDETWDGLQAVLGKGRKAGNRSNAATMLLRIAFCADCHSPLYAAIKPGSKAEPRRYYYTCGGKQYEGCPTRLIPMKELDQAVSDSFLATYGHRPHFKRKLTNGNDRERKLAEIGQAIADLTTERFVHQIIRPDYDTHMAKLQAEHKRLANSKPEPPAVRRIPTGITIGEYWASLDTQGKRQYLIRLGVKVYAKREPDDLVLVTIDGGALDADLDELEVA
jgi:site-specific DNA recombinase